MTEKEKKEIDAMSHFEMCRLWRFGASGNPLFTGETGEYFEKRLFGHFGGFNSVISNQLGWGK